mmetsp:Transcript_8666/g.23307  ORF Transcript_8666/g.23307 Transcript_8666/m.23307 type:complete len:1245 (-) Transcript_8666:122-3856(-)
MDAAAMGMAGADADGAAIIASPSRRVKSDAERSRLRQKGRSLLETFRQRRQAGKSTPKRPAATLTSSCSSPSGSVKEYHLPLRAEEREDEVDEKVGEREGEEERNANSVTEGGQTQQEGAKKKGEGEEEQGRHAYVAAISTESSGGEEEASNVRERDEANTISSTIDRPSSPSPTSAGEEVGSTDKERGIPPTSTASLLPSPGHTESDSNEDSSAAIIQRRSSEDGGKQMATPTSAAPTSIGTHATTSTSFSPLSATPITAEAEELLSSVSDVQLFPSSPPPAVARTVARSEGESGERAVGMEDSREGKEEGEKEKEKRRGEMRSEQHSGEEVANQLDYAELSPSSTVPLSTLLNTTPLERVESRLGEEEREEEELEGRGSKEGEGVGEGERKKRTLRRALFGGDNEEGERKEEEEKQYAEEGKNIQNEVEVKAEGGGEKEKTDLRSYSAPSTSAMHASSDVSEHRGVGMSGHGMYKGAATSTDAYSQGSGEEVSRSQSWSDDGQRAVKHRKMTEEEEKAILRSSFSAGSTTSLRSDLTSTRPSTTRKQGEEKVRGVSGSSHTHPPALTLVEAKEVARVARQVRVSLAMGRDGRLADIQQHLTSVLSPSTSSLPPLHEEEKGRGGSKKRGEEKRGRGEASTLTYIRHVAATPLLSRVGCSKGEVGSKRRGGGRADKNRADVVEKWEAMRRRKEEKRSERRARNNDESVRLDESGVMRTTMSSNEEGRDRRQDSTSSLPSFYQRYLAWSSGHGQTRRVEEKSVQTYASDAAERERAKRRTSERAAMKSGGEEAFDGLASLFKGGEAGVGEYGGRGEKEYSGKVGSGLDEYLGSDSGRDGGGGGGGGGSDSIIRELSAENERLEMRVKTQAKLLIDLSGKSWTEEKQEMEAKQKRLEDQLRNVKEERDEIRKSLSSIVSTLMAEKASLQARLEGTERQRALDHPEDRLRRWGNTPISIAPTIAEKASTSVQTDMVPSPLPHHHEGGNSLYLAPSETAGGKVDVSEVKGGEGREGEGEGEGRGGGGEEGSEGVRVQRLSLALSESDMEGEEVERSERRGKSRRDGGENEVQNRSEASRSGGDETPSTSPPRRHRPRRLPVHPAHPHEVEVGEGEREAQRRMRGEEEQQRREEASMPLPPPSHPTSHHEGVAEMNGREPAPTQAGTRVHTSTRVPSLLPHQQVGVGVGAELAPEELQMHLEKREEEEPSFWSPFAGMISAIFGGKRSSRTGTPVIDKQEVFEGHYIFV